MSSEHTFVPTANNPSNEASMNPPESNPRSKKPTYEQLVAFLRQLMNRAWMRQQYREADEIADAIGDPRPTDHELADMSK